MSIVAPASAVADIKAQAPDMVKPTLAVIIDLNCSFCRQVVARADYLQSIASDAGVSLVWVPIPNDGNIKFSFAEKTFVSVAKKMPQNAHKVLSAMYDIQDIQQKMQTKSDVVVWMETKAYGVTDWLSFVEEASSSVEIHESMQRSLRLAGAVNISQFPSFAIIGDGNKRPYQVANIPDAPLNTRIQHIEKWLADYKESSRK